MIIDLILMIARTAFFSYSGENGEEDETGVYLSDVCDTCLLAVRLSLSSLTAEAILYCNIHIKII